MVRAVALLLRCSCAALVLLLRCSCAALALPHAARPGALHAEDVLRR